MIDALLAALRERAAFAALVRGELRPLPATGTAHGHVQLPGGLLARVAHAHEGDHTAALRLAAQAAAFRHLESTRRTPCLHGLVEPRTGLPGGALIVEQIAGRAPRLPEELPAIADTLARIHGLPLPPPGSAIPVQKNPFAETLAAVERTACCFLDQAVTDPGARAEIVDELCAVRDLGRALARREQPIAVALADTHPGNFMIDRDGIAWFVDLEKVHVGSPAIDLAHATLATSTLWHPQVGRVLSRDEVRDFYAIYIGKLAPTRAAALDPWLQPMRRLTWLRTTLFMARWRVQTRSPRDLSNPGQWSDAALDPPMKAHIDRCIDQCFDRDMIRAIRSEWAD